MRQRLPQDVLREATRFHVLGVAGTAMATFAGMLASRGATVRGSDAACYPPMSDMLASLGIPVTLGYAAANLDWGPDMVIVGNVIRRDNVEATAMRERGLPHVSFPEALGTLFLEERHPVVVTGTHGKTTTTSLCAWLLECGGMDPGLLVGGVPHDFGVSFKLGHGQHMVVEGDEYDTAYFDKGPKFLHYRPQTAVITNIEFDHADIYPDVGAIEDQFARFARLVPADGRLIYWAGDDRASRVARQAQCVAEGYDAQGIGEAGANVANAAWWARHATSDADGTHFELVHRGQSLGRFLSPLFGVHNLLNAVGALAVALGSGVARDRAAEGLRTFRGVKKRHEVKGVQGGVTVIDDFAHHPTAVRETVRAVRRRFPAARLWCCFEVESNTSRRRVFQDAYPPAFEGAHAVLFCKPLEKADHLPEAERLSLPEVVATLEGAGIQARVIPEVDDMVDWLRTRVQPGDVVLGMSGRHFHGLHDKLLAALKPAH